MERYDIITANLDFDRLLNSDEEIADINNKLVEINGKLEKYTSKADAFDYALSVASGILCGAIDSVYVGEINITQDDIDLSHEQVNRFIEKYAKERGIKEEHLKDYVGELEKKFVVAQDNAFKGLDIGVGTKNHHLADLAHHPTPLGLVAAICVQFFRVGTFISQDGKWHFVPVDKNLSKVELINIWMPAILSGLSNWLTSYLFLYDPDHNYIYKATEARAFADCVEFYEDWSSGDSFKLDVYYKMCDQLVEAIKADEKLLKTDMSRFDGKLRKEPKPLYADPEKHVLAFDIIYCCGRYGLFDGISFERPNTKERQLLKERKEKALNYLEDYKSIKEKYELLVEAEDFVKDSFSGGSKVKHRKFGEGTVKEYKDDTIIVDFSDVGKKKLGANATVGNGLITSYDEGYDEKIKKYKDVLKAGNQIKDKYKRAEKAMNEYIEYLD